MNKNRIIIINGIPCHLPKAKLIKKLQVLFKSNNIGKFWLCRLNNAKCNTKEAILEMKNENEALLAKNLLDKYPLECYQIKYFLSAVLDHSHDNWKQREKKATDCNATSHSAHHTKGISSKFDREMDLMRKQRQLIEEERQILLMKRDLQLEEYKKNTHSKPHTVTTNFDSRNPSDSMFYEDNIPGFENPVEWFDDNPNRMSHDQAVTFDPMSHDQAVTFDPMSHDQAVTFDPMSHDQAVTFDLMSHDQAVTFDPMSHDQAVTFDHTPIPNIKEKKQPKPKTNEQKQRNLSEISQFITGRAISKASKVFSKTFSSAEKKYFYKNFSGLIKQRLTKALKNKPLKTADEIMNEYWILYPIKGDGELIAKVCNDFKNAQGKGYFNYFVNNVDGGSQQPVSGQRPNVVTESEIQPDLIKYCTDNYNHFYNETPTAIASIDNRNNIINNPNTRLNDRSSGNRVDLHDTYINNDYKEKSAEDSVGIGNRDWYKEYNKSRDNDVWKDNIYMQDNSIIPNSSKDNYNINNVSYKYIDKDTGIGCTNRGLSNDQRISRDQREVSNEMYERENLESTSEIFDRGPNYISGRKRTYDEAVSGVNLNESDDMNVYYGKVRRSDVFIEGANDIISKNCRDSNELFKRREKLSNEESTDENRRNVDCYEKGQENVDITDNNLDITDNDNYYHDFGSPNNRAHSSFTKTNEGSNKNWSGDSIAKDLNTQDGRANTLGHNVIVSDQYLIREASKIVDINKPSFKTDLRANSSKRNVVNNHKITSEIPVAKVSKPVSSVDKIATNGIQGFNQDELESLKRKSKNQKRKQRRLNKANADISATIKKEKPDIPIQTPSKVRLAIIAEDSTNPLYGDDDKISIQQLINQLYLKQRPKPLPMVTLGKEILFGAITINCTLQFEEDWIRRCINGAVICNTKKLKVINVKDAPKPVRMIWECKNLAAVDINEALSLLELFNPGLKTTHWRLVQVSKQADSINRIIDIDSDSAKVIENAGYKMLCTPEPCAFKVISIYKF